MIEWGGGWWCGCEGQSTGCESCYLDDGVHGGWLTWW